ncbi:hypothetical protein [Nocardia pseudovaccinii]|uniref:hypothetical protein n=1 Tax=Nocardia pseudovaccinii TaxID=189540 RepID=UPI0007A4D49B|nr:hypothetical protein [Nocardia pseudovaccinii]
MQHLGAALASDPRCVVAAALDRAALQLAEVATLVTAVGSAAVTRGNLAERSVREATFTLVFGSRPAIKAAPARPPHPAGPYGCLTC